MLSLLAASPLRDSKLTMIDGKLTNQNASFTGGRSKNLRLTGDGFQEGGFSSPPPSPTPLSLAVSLALDRLTARPRWRRRSRTPRFSGFLRYKNTLKPPASLLARQKRCFHSLLHIYVHVCDQTQCPVHITNPTFTLTARQAGN